MKNATALTGIQFPVSSKGKRSTTETGKSIFAASYQHVDEAFSARLIAERKWRGHYAQYMPAMLHSAAQSRHTSEKIAEQGLASCYNEFEFIRNGQAYKLNQAMALFTQPLFRTAKIKGLTARPKHAISIQHKGRTLSGESLRQQISVWHETNIIEKSHAQDLLSMLDDNNKQDVSKKYFVLLGASSEIGPISLLLTLGANIIAIGRENSAHWMRLIAMARGSSGNLFIPCKCETKGMSDQQVSRLAGADLLTQTPEIGSWLNSFKKPLTLGNYAYLDGADHVRLAMAMDAIVTRLAQKRDDISLAYLLTPSDVYAVPKSVIENSIKRFTGIGLSGLLKAVISKVTFGALFSPSIVSKAINTQGNEFGVLDNLVPQQGPNYVLAKRIQRWRAIVSVKNGLRVSCNVAPATSTQSVMSNKFFAAATIGSESFGVEVFTPKTANALMTLQMIEDVSSEKPLERGEALFIHGANHGGSWHMGFCFRSVLVPSLLVGLVQKMLPNFKACRSLVDVSSQPA